MTRNGVQCAFYIFGFVMAAGAIDSMFEIWTKPGDTWVYVTISAISFLIGNHFGPKAEGAPNKKEFPND